MMESDAAEDILVEAANIAGEHYAQLELDAARSLIRDAFGILPWELQEYYQDVQELYRLGKLAEANLAWDLWMDKARDMGLI